MYFPLVTSFICFNRKILLDRLDSPFKDKEEIYQLFHAMEELKLGVVIEMTDVKFFYINPMIIADKDLQKFVANHGVSSLRLRRMLSVIEVSTLYY